MPQENPHIDLDVLERTLRFIDVDGADEQRIELVRLYISFANGSALPQPAIIEALENEAGGTLAVGWLPIQADLKWVVNQNDLSWCQHLAGVMAEVQRTGEIPKKSSGPLGAWLNNQRYDLSKGKLSLERKAKLDAALPGWEITRMSESVWDAKLAEVVSEVQQTGVVPKSESGTLGRWLASQRAALTKGKLSPVRKAKLNAALPGWNVTYQLESAWDAKLAELVSEVQRTGEIPKENSGPLGKWLGHQRSAFNSGKLSPLRKSKLDTALPGWNVTLDDVWDAKLAKLVSEVQRTGQMPKSDSGPLGSWFSKQRSALRRGKLSPVRKAKLDTALPGWNVTLDDVWDAKLAKLVSEVQRTGEIPKKSSGTLGSWLSKQRLVLRKGKLSPERQAKLDAALPGWESTHMSELTWDAKLAELLSEVQCTGEMPKESSGTLGAWLSRQRTAHNKGKLSPAREAKLSAALPGWENATRVRNNTRGQSD